MHPTPSSPVTAISESDLPVPHILSEVDVLRATTSLSPSSAPGPDGISIRLLKLVFKTTISTEAGVIDLSAITALCNRFAWYDLPNSVLPLFTAATLILI